MKKFVKNKGLNLKLKYKLENILDNHPEIQENNSPVLYSVLCKNPMSLTKNQQKKSFFVQSTIFEKELEDIKNKKILIKKQEEKKTIKTEKREERFENLKFKIKVPLILYENRNERKFKSKLKKLKNISIALQKIFKNENIDNINLDLYEIKILISILERKFNKKFTKKKFHKCNLIEIKEVFKKIIKLIREEVSNKRVEENNKFIYKFILRRLKLRFINENNFKNNQESNDLFYKYFFTDLSKKMNLPIIEFHDPLNLKKMKKSLNNKFFQLIFQSEKFLNQFMTYHDENFMDTYLKLLEKKFHKFLIKYEKSFKDEKNDKAVEKMISVINSSKRIKFPWTKNEIENAKLFFKKNIYKQLNKLKNQ